MGKTPRLFDDQIKRMAIELSYLKGSVKGAADELDMDPSLLSKWRRDPRFNEDHAQSLSAVRAASGDPEGENLKLHKALREMTLERDILTTLDAGWVWGVGRIKKGSRHLLQGRPERFGFIKAHKEEFPARKMCKVVQVSSSGYYYWLKHPVGKREIERSELSVKIKECYDGSKGTYSSPRITKALQAGGADVSRPQVARIMRGHGPEKHSKAKWRVCTTESGHGLAVYANLLDRDFHADKLREKWVGDLTCIPTDEGWLYLTTVMDLTDRKIIGWAQSESMEAELTTVPALRMALANRTPVNGMVFYSDRGGTVCLRGV